jgi:hypothetical protein
VLVCGDILGVRAARCRRVRPRGGGSLQFSLKFHMPTYVLIVLHDAFKIITIFIKIPIFVHILY